MGYDIELNTRDLRGQCSPQFNTDKLVDTAYIKQIEEKFNINWAFEFEKTDDEEFQIIWNGEGRDGYIDDIMKALLHVMRENDLVITGTVPFTECVGDMTNGVAILTKNQITIIRYLYVDETNNSVSNISDLEHVVRLEVIK